MLPDEIHVLPTDNTIDISKMGYGGTIATDTCNSARKIRRVLVERIGGNIHKMDCMHHLRNVWFGGVERALTCHLNVFLKVDNIDKNLRVSASMTALIRAFDKEFSLAATYPKGHREEFKEWIKSNHAGELLLHIERSFGSCQPLFVEGAPAIYWNCQYCIEFWTSNYSFQAKEIYYNRIYVLFFLRWRWLLYPDCF